VQPKQQSGKHPDWLGASPLTTHMIDRLNSAAARLNRFPISPKWDSRSLGVRSPPG